MSGQILEKTLRRGLRDLCDAKLQIIGAVPDLTAKTNDPQLVAALQTLKRDGEAQLERLEAVFAMLYEKPEPEACWPVAAFLREAREALVGAHQNPAAAHASVATAFASHQAT